MALLLCMLFASIGMAAEPAGASLPSADQVIVKMMAHDTERLAKLQGYTATRRYVLENQRHSKRAEMLVHMTVQPDGSKEFETVSASGWAGARKYVFPRLLEAEAEAAKPAVRERSRIVPENYTFEMAGTEQTEGHPAYVISISPKTPNKYLTRGRIWVSTDEFAIVRIEGEPAKTPSFWTRSVHFVHTYSKQGSFWFPVSDRSVTDVRLFGNTELTIDYFDYAPSTHN